MTTLVTADMITQLRRMVGEPTTTTYSDAILTAIIERYPALDENGEAYKIPAVDSEDAVTFTPGMDPLDLIVNDDWIPTYDLNAAASDIWAEKAAVVVADFDFSADGGNFSRSQVYEQMMKLSRSYGAKRKVRVTKLKPEPHMRQTGSVN